MGVLDPPVNLGIPAEYGTMGYDERVTPSFTRYAGPYSGAVLSQANQNMASGKTAAPSVYWPHLVYAGGVPGLTPVDQWYMYYSTNHAPSGNVSGIWLATAPTPYGPWTGQGQVYIDSSTGTAYQTENAQVIWDDDISLFRMYYKVFNGLGAVYQMTGALATSPDGITWTRWGTVIDAPSGQVTWFPGQNQTAYMRPFRVGRHWYMHLLANGGQSGPLFGLAQSGDGYAWLVDGRVLSTGADQLVDAPGASPALAQNGLMIAWNSGNVVWWRGRLWWIGLIQGNGGNTNIYRMACAPVHPNLRSLVGRPQYILWPIQGIESTAMNSVSAHVYQGRIYLTYETDANVFLAVSN